MIDDQKYQTFILKTHSVPFSAWKQSPEAELGVELQFAEWREFKFYLQSNIFNLTKFKCCKTVEVSGNDAIGSHGVGALTPLTSSAFKVGTFVVDFISNGFFGSRPGGGGDMALFGAGHMTRSFIQTATINKHVNDTDTITIFRLSSALTTVPLLK